MNSLCRPLQELRCFRCCPPTRPAGYDHLDHRAQMARLLRENTAALNQNDPQAQVFTALSPPAQEAAAALCKGQDSFAFSSPQTNLLWGLLAWGEEVVAASLAGWRSGAGPWFVYLTSHPRPKARVYLLARVFQNFDPSEFGRLDPDRFEAEAEALCRRLGPLSNSPLGGAPLTHRLGLEPGVADLLRFGLGLTRLDPVPALKLQGRLKEEAARLAWRLSPQR